ncbi:Translocon-associated protein subunit beta [Nymphaea thermarum]|nr:Translocon-associated protein subunit beta [Nymphaea thermarum]
MARSELVASLLLPSFCFFLLFASLVAVSASDAPFLIVHKKVDLSRLKSGAERLSVSIDVYNEGTATAYDVSLSDDSWTTDLFELVTGSTSKSWERLDAGASLSHSFILESKKKGSFHGSPAVVKFRIPSKAALQEAYSTPILPLDILAERPPEKKFEWDSISEVLEMHYSTTPAGSAIKESVLDVCEDSLNQNLNAYCGFYIEKLWI